MLTLYIEGNWQKDSSHIQNEFDDTEISIKNRNTPKRNLPPKRINKNKTDDGDDFTSMLSKINKNKKL